jgi:putative DNA methylase
VLSKKKEGKVIWIEPKVDYESKRIRYHIRDTGHPTHGSTSRQGFNCVATGTSIPFSYIREEGAAGRIGAELVAVVCDSNDGRKFVAPDSVDHKPVDFAAPEFLNGMLQGKAANDVYKYGMKTWGSLFTPRQLKALVTFSELLTEVRTEIEALDSELKDDKIPLREGGCGRTAYADALVTYLAFVIDKCADFWSTICTWNAPNSQIRYTFSKQAIPMTWDFAEVNPFSEKTGSWDAMLRGVAKGIRTLPTRSTAEVKQRDAASRVREVGRCVVSTDPPYYDNISYSDLSDFFFVWLRHNLKDVWPDECATLLTPKEEELIADAKRAGSKAAAKAHFENGMETVFREAASNCDERYPATIFYAFKASETENSGSVSTGWETFLTGLLNSGFSVTATWPVRTEFANKIGIAAGDNMLASSIVLACRRRIKDAPLATRSDFVAALKREMRSSIRVLQKQNIAPVDLAQSAIGPGIAIFSSYSRVVEADGKNMTVRTALILINEILSEVLSGEEGSFDAETRFALTWYDQFGFGPGPYGDADICAKAKNTTVDAVIRSGLARSTSGRVALITKDLLPSEWNPATDQSLTIWEVTHHLIKSLEHSEQRAAELLQKAGPGLGESARQLAYLLFQIADQKRRTEDAATYNMLVTAWPQLQRLAAGEPSTTDESLF